ncbi:hypothetical protein C1H46_026671 [Malus baccata]|uniref:Symplekin C-terminal domain-containing protein n=1 Tax=Malus baccata TaxID=106549 RepID=A0A540LNC3_MALBA|nr:hypothetical protein C1H46_026671 [Malus baccata]
MDVEDASLEQCTSLKVENASQEQVTNMNRKAPLNIPPSLSTDMSEELSPRSAVADISLLSSTATSVVLYHHLVLPKMSELVVILSNEEKDRLQQLAFTRIIEAYKQIAVAGASQIQCSLLISLGVEVIWRGRRERDFFSSTTATSVYEMFLSTAVETLRDSFPPSDKSLSRWLGEVPYLPDSVLKLLECMCSPGNCGKTEKETQGGDRVTQGLSIVWSLILLRPPLRDPCLKIALQSAVHRLEEVRMKVICLVANKLYPLSSIAQRIEDFGIEMLLSLKSVDATEKIDAEGSKNELQKDSDSDKHSNEPPSVSGNSIDISSDNHQSCSSQSVSSSSIAEAQRCLSLYFALCTKNIPFFAKYLLFMEAHQRPSSRRFIAKFQYLYVLWDCQPNLLEIISDPPTGSENLLMQVLRTLTDGIVPSQELIFTVRKLYDSKLKVTDACNACFEQRQIFIQQVIAKVLNQLVEQIPLPLLFMRTVFARHSCLSCTGKI